MYTIKIDGMRTLIFYDGKETYKFQSAKQDIFQLQERKFSVFDCEEYEGEFHIFDILIEEGDDVQSLSYFQRLEILNTAKLPANSKRKKFFKIEKLTDLTPAF